MSEPLQSETTAAEAGASSTASPAARPGNYFPCLDAYRAIGMTMVLLNHAAYSTGFISRSPLGPFIARFDIAVPMFFVMSGFLLFRPYATNIIAGRPPPPWRRFYRRRALRVIPAYWVALAGLGLLFGLPIVSAAGWLGNATLAPAFGFPVQACENGRCHIAYGITQAWSIGVEVTFYLALPIIAAVTHRLCRRAEPTRRPMVVFAMCVAIYLLGAGFRVAVVAFDVAWARQSLLWLPMFLDFFALGMAIAALSTLVEPGVSTHSGASTHWAHTVGEHPWWCWLAAGAMFLVMTRFNPPVEPFGLNGKEYLPRQFIYGLASAAWLWPAIFGRQDVGLLRRALGAKPLVFLGGISLTFYLWHLVLIEQAKALTVPDWSQRVAMAARPDPDNPLMAVATFTGNYPLVVALSWTASFVVATALYFAIERPFVQLKDRPLRQLLPARRSGK